MLMKRRPNFLDEMIANCYHYSFEQQQESIIGGEEEAEIRPTMTEICIDNGATRCAPTSSNARGTEIRPFKLLVKNQVFTVDSEKLAQISPIFAFMCFGRDFEAGRELTREIVDEKSDDIAIFLHCVHDHSLINEWNFATLLRLANKYQVDSLTSACVEYILKANFDGVKADQVLTMLLTANDHHLPVAALKKLILRLAAEDKIVYTRLRMNRFLPAHLYTALISANLNLAHIKEIERMNGHFFRVERGKTMYKRTFCVHCKKIIDAAECEGCRQAFCADHARIKPCVSEFGGKMLHQMRQEIVELNGEE